MDKFEIFKKRYFDHEALYSYYFELPNRDLAEEDLEPTNTNLPLFLFWNIDMLALQGLSKKLILEILNSQIKMLSQTDWSVRLVLATLSDKDRRETYSMADYFRLAAVSIAGITYGMNHTALQIGPYYIHYTTSNLVTLHDVENKSNAFVMLYPHKQFALKYSKDNMIALCRVIVEYNMGRDYDDMEHNCHNFVEAVFDEIKCPSFPEEGPIANFLKLVKTSRTGVNHMRIKNLEGQIIEFSDHAQLKKYCQTPSIKRLIDTPPSELEEKEYQLCEVLKAVERGFQIQVSHNKQLTNDELIFPKSENISMLHTQVDKITKYHKSQ